ncbi:MAG TPA: hypothetical protein VME19_13415 [Streptosporangiaceae bacterium]|nr:hypothetical protein [Streptosporangiaceae bacterium]
MGLPAYQQRVLDRMEGALKASEPHLAAMFAIFSRLSGGEPVGMESLAAQRRRWWLRPGATLAALVLAPVTFALVITGVLLGGPTHAGTCAVGMPAAVTVSRGNRSSCGSAVRPGQRPASSAAVSSCSGPAVQTGTAATAHFAVWARDAEASWPSGAGASGLC